MGVEEGAARSASLSVCVRVCACVCVCVCECVWCVCIHTCVCILKIDCYIINRSHDTSLHTPEVMSRRWTLALHCYHSRRHASACSCSNGTVSTMKK